MANQRRRVLYSGQVQGVGFRWSTRRALEGLPVTGYVRNLADGRVELVLEGSRDDTEEALARVHRRLGGYVQDREETTSPATGEFDEFEIRR